jgi:general stress protein CsbA
MSTYTAQNLKVILHFFTQSNQFVKRLIINQFCVVRVINVSTRRIVIALAEGGEIPFGPLLFSLRINDNNEPAHALSKAIFLKQFVCSETGRYAVLTEYQHKKSGYTTQLVLLDVQFMNYAVIKAESVILKPLTITESEIEYQQATEDKRIPIDENIHWQPLLSPLDDAPLVEIFQRYGYQLKTFPDKSFALRIKYTPTVKQSLLFVAFVALGFLLGVLYASEIFKWVALMIASVLIFAAAYAIFAQHFFLLKVDTHKVQKRIFSTQLFSHQDIANYSIACEPVLRVRSTQPESYNWYLKAVLRSGKQVNLIHFNAHTKQQGLQDLLTATTLFGNVDVQVK